MLKRLVAVAAMLAASITAHAEVSVVKIINFSCPYCRASESMDEPIRRAVQEGGGRLVYAALPADESSDGSRELVYYATRDAFPQLEPQVRAALFKGAQDLGYPLMTTEQTAEWLSTEMQDQKIDWTRITQAAAQQPTRAAFERAVRLTLKSGAQALPSYVIVKDGQLIKTLDVDSGGGNYSALREAVLTAIEKAKASTPSK
jgi:protein-disulfide isomerase